VKPENILLTANWEPRLSDFGCVKIIAPSEAQRESVKKDPDFVGTPEFMAPELMTLEGRLPENQMKALDLWGLGCTIYQLLTGKLLFSGGSEYLIYMKVQRMEFSLDAVEDKEAKDLLSKLLKKNPKERLGFEDVGALTSHPFFHAVDWDNLEKIVPQPLSQTE
jgi:serine/threonine protein kinase